MFTILEVLNFFHLKTARDRYHSAVDSSHVHLESMQHRIPFCLFVCCFFVFVGFVLFFLLKGKKQRWRKVKDAEEVSSHQFLRLLKTNVSEFIDNPSITRITTLRLRNTMNPITYLQVSATNRKSLSVL